WATAKTSSAVRPMVCSAAAREPMAVMCAHKREGRCSADKMSTHRETDERRGRIQETARVKSGPAHISTDSHNTTRKRPGAAPGGSFQRALETEFDYICVDIERRILMDTTMDSTASTLAEPIASRNLEISTSVARLLADRREHSREALEAFHR